jgi:hypothetical protein
MLALTTPLAMEAQQTLKEFQIERQKVKCGLCPLFPSKLAETDWQKKSKGFQFLSFSRSSQTNKPKLLSLSFVFQILTKTKINVRETIDFLNSGNSTNRTRRDLSSALDK